MYFYNNKNKGKVRDRSNMESKLAFPYYNPPLSMSVPQSCGKGVMTILTASSDVSFWEYPPSVPLQRLRFVFLCYPGNFYFTPVYLKGIYNLKIKSSVLFSRTFFFFFL